MRIFSTKSVKEIDALTIQYESIESFALMERAAGVLVDALLMHYPESLHFVIFAGLGNNGGDGIVMARLLLAKGYTVDVWMLASERPLSPDCNKALESLKLSFPSVVINKLANGDKPVVPKGAVVVDALFGSGLTRPLEGECARAVQVINSCGSIVVSVDVPSGLMGEDNGLSCEERCIVRADKTFTLQFPKLSMFFPENEKYVGSVQVLDIGLSVKAMDEVEPLTRIVGLDEVHSLTRPRSRCAHKGNFGRALLVAGSRGMAGASVLAARAAMRSGLGLLTVHLPSCNNVIMQTALPEAMTSIDDCDCCFSSVPDVGRYTAIGVGPGLGVDKRSANALHRLIRECTVPMVVDADALNILSHNPEWLDKLPSGSVLTPHPGEFARLATVSSSGYDALMCAREFAKRYKVVVVLKGAYTIIVDVDGSFCINSKGNAGMATGGSGDALTGVVLALLARGYSAFDAARLAVYVHSVAGDAAAAKYGQTSLVAGDIVDHLPYAWQVVECVGNKQNEMLW